MKKLNLIICFLILTSVAAAGSKDETRMKAAEQQLADKKYADAKATFEDLKDTPRFREKCHLYLAMIYNESGQVDNALAALDEFSRFVTERTDVTLIKSAEALNEELARNYGTLDVAVFDKGEHSGVDLGFYNVVFRSEGGLGIAQENRLKSINKTLSQAHGLLSWKSDGTFMKCSLRNFPIRLYDTTPMIAEVNGVPIYFRFDFQARQGLWIPGDVVEGEAQFANEIIYERSAEPVVNVRQGGNRSLLKYLVIGIGAAALGAGVVLAASQ